MHPDVLLDVHISAICHRHRFTDDPSPVIDELRQIAGGRTRILAAAAGHWVGYYEGPATAVLSDALRREFPDSQPWIEAGRTRRATPAHSTGEYT